MKNFVIFYYGYSAGKPIRKFLMLKSGYVRLHHIQAIGISSLENCFTHPLGGKASF